MNMNISMKQLSFEDGIRLLLWRCVPSNILKVVSKEEQDKEQYTTIAQRYVNIHISRRLDYNPSKQEWRVRVVTKGQHLRNDVSDTTFTSAYTSFLQGISTF